MSAAGNLSPADRARLAGKLREIASRAPTWAPPLRIAASLLEYGEAPPRSLEQELRAWAADAERYDGAVGVVDWCRGYRCAATDVMEIVDEWSCDARKPDPEDVAEQGIADLVYELAEVKQRLDDHVDRFERIEAKIADLESRVARL